MEVFFNRSISFCVRCFLANISSSCTFDTSPASKPIVRSLKSALSCLSKSLYSAREVIIRYGSKFSFVTKSSISTPIYACERSSMICSFPWIKSPAFIPAISPCAAASSYPLLPLNCPALKSP